MSKWIVKGETVKVIAGNDKGRTGVVASRSCDRVVIHGINVRKKHVKSRGKQADAGIVTKEMSLHISNVVLCNRSGDRIKVRSREIVEGGKELYYMEGETAVVHRRLRNKS